MISLVSAFKCIITIRSGERKFSKKGSDNFTGVLNRLAGSEAMSERSARLLCINNKLTLVFKAFRKPDHFLKVPIGIPRFSDYRISFFGAS